MSEKQTGVIKFWHGERGYGFVTPDAGGKDVFLHISALAEGVKVCENDRIRYNLSEGQRGPKAVGIEFID